MPGLPPSASVWPGLLAVKQWAVGPPQDPVDLCRRRFSWQPVEIDSAGLPHEQDVVSLCQLHVPANFSRHSTLPLRREGGDVAWHDQPLPSDAACEYHGSITYAGEQGPPLSPLPRPERKEHFRWSMAFRR